MMLTISSFTPKLGHTGGGAMIEIVGTGFRLATPQTAAPNENVPAAPPSMRVLFGAHEAERVIVLSGQRLFASTPLHSEGDVPITCVVIDDDGDTLETATTEAKFAFRLPQLSDTWGLNQIINTLIDRLVTILHPNIRLMDGPDYSDPDDEAEAFIIDLAKLPAIALLGPDITENRFYSVNSETKVPISGDESLAQRERKTVDLNFEMVGFSDNKGELLSLMQATIETFHKLKMLPHPAAPDDRSQDVEVDLVDLPKPSKVANAAGLSMFRAALVIRGFDLGGLPRFENDLTSSYANRSRDDDSAIQLTSTDQLSSRSISPSGVVLPPTTPARRPADLRGGLSYPRFSSIPARPRKP